MWAPGRIIADEPEAIAGGKAADDVVAFIRGRVAELKEELLAEAPYFVLLAGAQATIKALHERSVRVRVLTNSLASNNQLAAHSCYAKTRRHLLENGMELYELRPDTDAFRPGCRSVPGGRGRPCTPRPWSSTARQCSSAASTSIRRDQHGSRPLYREPGVCREADGVHGDRRRARQQLPRRGSAVGSSPTAKLLPIDSQV